MILARKMNPDYVKFGTDLEHIINFTEVKRISIYLNP